MVSINMSYFPTPKIVAAGIIEDLLCAALLSLKNIKATGKTVQMQKIFHDRNVHVVRDKLSGGLLLVHWSASLDLLIAVLSSSNCAEPH